MRPVYHIFCLYALVAILMVLSYQRHAKLQAAIDLLKQFQQTSVGNRKHIFEDIHALRATVDNLHGKNTVPVHTHSGE